MRKGYRSANKISGLVITLLLCLLVTLPFTRYYTFILSLEDDSTILDFSYQQFDLYCETEAYSYLATSLVFVSWAVGAVVLGWTSDRYAANVDLYVTCNYLELLGIQIVQVGRFFNFGKGSPIVPHWSMRRWTFRGALHLMLIE